MGYSTKTKSNIKVKESVGKATTLISSSFHNEMSEFSEAVSPFKRIMKAIKKQEKPVAIQEVSKIKLNKGSFDSGIFPPGYWDRMKTPKERKKHYKERTTGKKKHILSGIVWPKKLYSFQQTPRGRKGAQERVLSPEAPLSPDNLGLYSPIRETESNKHSELSPNSYHPSFDKSSNSISIHQQSYALQSPILNPESKTIEEGKKRIQSAKRPKTGRTR